MRVIAGKFKGRSLHSSDIRGLRPSADRTREGIMSALENRLDLDDTVVLDLFAGVGSYAIEAVSRGAAYAICIESNVSCINLIKKNISKLSLGSQCDIVQLTLKPNGYPKLESELDARMRTHHRDAIDLIFFDPPYAQFNDYVNLLDGLAESHLTFAQTWWVLEAYHDQILESEHLVLDKRYVYGDSCVMLCRSKHDSGALTHE